MVLQLQDFSCKQAHDCSEASGSCDSLGPCSFASKRGAKFRGLPCARGQGGNVARQMQKNKCLFPGSSFRGDQSSWVPWVRFWLERESSPNRPSPGTFLAWCPLQTFLCGQRYHRGNGQLKLPDCWSGAQITRVLQLSGRTGMEGGRGCGRPAGREWRSRLPDGWTHRVPEPHAACTALGKVKDGQGGGKATFPRVCRTGAVWTARSLAVQLRQPEEGPRRTSWQGPGFFRGGRY